MDRTGATVVLLEPSSIPLSHRLDIGDLDGPFGTHLCAHTSGDGLFSIENVPPGAWDLFGWRRRWQETVVHGVQVGSESESVAVRVQLPESASVEGVILLPFGCTLDGFEVRIDSVDHDAGCTVSIGKDAGFHAEFLKPGLTRFRLRMPELYGIGGVGLGGEHRDVAAIESRLLPGQNNRVEIDAKDNWPGAIDVTVTAPVRLFSVLATCLHDRENVVHCVETDQDGVARLGPLPTGQYTIALRDRGGVHVGYFEDPIPIDLRAGSHVAREIIVEQTLGRVLLLDAATGEPLRGSGVVLSNPYGVVEARKADAEGALELNLPPGMYGVSRGPNGPDMTSRTESVLAWPPVDPSQGVVLRLVP